MNRPDVPFGVLRVELFGVTDTKLKSSVMKTQLEPGDKTEV